MLVQCKAQSTQFEGACPLGTQRYCNVESTSLALVKRRNNVVCRWGGSWKLWIIPSSRFIHFLVSLLAILFL